MAPAAQWDNLGRLVVEARAEGSRDSGWPGAGLRGRVRLHLKLPPLQRAAVCLRLRSGRACETLVLGESGISARPCQKRRRDRWLEGNQPALRTFLCAASVSTSGRPKPTLLLPLRPNARAVTNAAERKVRRFLQGEDHKAKGWLRRGTPPVTDCVSHQMTMEMFKCLSAYRPDGM